MLLRLKAHIKRAASDEPENPATRSESLTDTWVPVETDAQKALRKEQQKNKRREYQREYDKQRQEEKRLKGECHDCSKPAVPGKGGLCEQHHKEQLDRQNKRMKEKRLKGECYDCSQPAVLSGRCEQHYEKLLERQTKNRENKNAIS